MKDYRHVSCLPLGVAFIAVCMANAASADEPLHVRIDRLVAAAQVGPASPLASDGEFLRRVYLDLTGEIPSSAETRAFLDDPSPAKRAALIDRLLASPNYARHMANVFSVMFMERRADKVIPAAEWQQYLRQSFAANKPYNQLAREILGADGVDPALRPAAKFYLDRDADPHALTRDVGRIFFGRDLQCAQCHDHPNVESYFQADYYGLFACFGRGFLFTDPKDKRVFYAEKAEGGAPFESVFDRTAKGETRPRLPGGLQLSEPAFAPGDEYTVKPSDGVRPVPKYSRRARLAEEATSGANRAFNENIANRLWAQLLGRGLVEPLDLHHVDNPPANPELLALLGNEMVAMKFDIKAFLREIALSQAYQRSVDLPQDSAPAIDALAGNVPELEAELEKAATAARQSSEVVTQIQDELRAPRRTTVEIAAEIGKLAAAVAETQKAADAAQQALAQAQAALAAKQDAAKAVSEANAQTQQAVQKLPQEKPLLDAAAKFQERAAQLAGEVAAVAKSVSDQTELAKAANEKREAAKKSVDEANAKHAAATTAVEGIEAKSRDAIAKLQADRAAAREIERRLHTIKALVAWRQALAQRDTAQATLAKLEADKNNGKTRLSQLAVELPAKKAAFEQAQQQHAEAVKALSEAQQQFAVKKDLADTVALAATKAEVARSKIPGDNEVAQAVQAVKTRADQLTAEVAELQKQLTVRTQAADEVTNAVAASKQAFDAATAELATLEPRLAALEPELAAAAAKLTAASQQFTRATEECILRETRQFATASLKPMSAEQLAWSVMRAVGLADQLRAASDAEVNAKTPLTDAIRNDPAQMAARNQQIDEATYAKLQANAARFIELFATGPGAPGQDFFATADQALFFANDGLIRSWLAPSSRNLTERLNSLTDPRALAEELYLSVLTRRPTDAEIAETTQYLANRANERPAAVQELAWALLTSLEFRFNH